MIKSNEESIAENLYLYWETKDSIYFDNFYNCLYPIALKISILITKNSADSEDVVQTAFYSVFNQIETCQTIQEKNNSKIRSWFLAIVLNQSRLFVRTKVRHKSKSQRWEKTKQKPEPKNQMSEYLESKMKIAINNLDEIYRLPIILKYNEGLNSYEIADILKVNDSTLRVRISRGLSKLKAILVKDQDDFEKLLPSIALIKFEDFSSVNPIPKFANKDKINLKLLKKTELTKSIVKLVSIGISISFALGLFFYLKSIKKNTASLKPDVSIQPITSSAESKKELITSQKTKWDLTEGNLDGIRFWGKWEFQNNGMVTTGLKGLDATLLVLPIKSSQSSKITIRGLIEFDKTMTTTDYYAQGIPCKNEAQLIPKKLFNKMRIHSKIKETVEINGKMTQLFEATIYFTKEYICNRYHDGKLASICSIDTDYDQLGIYVRNFKTQIIEFSLLSDLEAQKVKDEIDKTLIYEK